MSAAAAMCSLDRIAWTGRILACHDPLSHIKDAVQQPAQFKCPHIRHAESGHFQLALRPLATFSKFPAKLRFQFPNDIFDRTL